MMAPGEPVVHDDWNRHWSTFGDAVAGNPGTTYRSRLILQMLGPVAADSRILEIGCGQGEFALHLAEMYPQVEVKGIDVSDEGVRRASLAAAERQLSSQFARRDLTGSSKPEASERGWATMAICSEVLEHVDDPGTFLRHASSYMAPGCRLVVTVPGGPRSAFDRHIGHRRHFNASRLRRLLMENDFEDVIVRRAGFPFFNLYRLVVILRGNRLIADIEQPQGSPLDSGASGAVLRFFERAFRHNLTSSPFGWQMVATARRTGGSNS